MVGPSEAHYSPAVSTARMPIYGVSQSPLGAPVVVLQARKCLAGAFSWLCFKRSFLPSHPNEYSNGSRIESGDKSLVVIFDGNGESGVPVLVVFQLSEIDLSFDSLAGI